DGIRAFHVTGVQTCALPISLRYTAVATDLEREEEVLFREGSIYAAIRASIAIPGVFTGVSWSNRFLVDGGVLNPVPVNHVSKKRSEERRVGQERRSALCAGQ